MELKYKSFKEVLINIFVGIFIGLSVIVPGISGSTMAITLKVYDKGMYAFSHFFKEFKKCALYCLPVIGGIILGFFTGVVAVKTLLDIFPFITICAFLGLMIGTYPVIFKEIKGQKITPKRSILASAGFIMPIVFAIISVLASGDANTLANIKLYHYIFFFILGLLISITQIVPSLSATVLMMMFGYYKALIGNLGFGIFRDYKLFFVYVTMGVGFLVGVFTFSKGIEALLNKARVPFFFVITGVSIGSIVSVFSGNDCVEIYKSWQFPSFLIELICGIILLLCTFVVSYIFTMLQEKKSKEEITK